MHIPFAADDAQAVMADRLEMGAARNEGDVVPRRREPHAEISADAAGADHTDSHDGGSTRLRPAA
jgi:hypothetical protein